MKTALPSTLAALIITMTALSPASAAVVTLENFDGIANGTLLSSVPRWSQQSGSTDTAVVSTSAGYQGPGATLSTVSLYRYAIPPAEVMTPGSFTTGYSVKMQLGSANNYQQAQVLLGKNDGVNGLAIVFDGGTSDSDADNTIKISSGGTSWGSITYNTAASSQWSSNTWYEISFTNINLVTTGYGSAVTGYVTITNVATQTALVSNYLVTGFGSSGTFNTIDSVVIGNKASARLINFDDISATVVPEPSVLSLLLPLLVLPLLSRLLRRSRIS